MAHLSSELADLNVTKQLMNVTEQSFFEPTANDAKESADPLPAIIHEAFLETFLMNVRDLNSHWGEGLNSNRELIPRHVAQMKRDFQVYTLSHIISYSLTLISNHLVPSLAFADSIHPPEWLPPFPRSALLQQSNNSSNNTSQRRWNLCKMLFGAINTSMTRAPCTSFPYSQKRRWLYKPGNIAVPHSWNSSRRLQPPLKQTR